MQNLKHELHELIRDNFLYAQNGDLGDGDSFLERGIIDSTGVLELVSLLEGRYEIKVRDEDLVPENLDSIERLAAFVVRRREGDAAYAG